MAMKKIKIITTTIVTFICFAALGMTLVSCNKIDEIEGMNDNRAYYGYNAFSVDFDYQDAAGPFDAAIKTAIGSEPILGGNDNKVVEACDWCYETLKPQLDGRDGTVIIIKTRHPDGKQKVLKEYKF